MSNKFIDVTDELEVKKEPEPMTILQEKMQWCETVTTVDSVFEKTKKLNLFVPENLGSSATLTVEGDLAEAIMKLIKTKASQLTTACNEFVAKVNAIK